MGTSLSLLDGLFPSVNCIHTRLTHSFKMLSITGSEAEQEAALAEAKRLDAMTKAYHVDNNKAPIKRRKCANKRKPQVEETKEEQEERFAAADCAEMELQKERTVVLEPMSGFLKAFPHTNLDARCEEASKTLGVHVTALKRTSTHAMKRKRAPRPHDDDDDDLLPAAAEPRLHLDASQSNPLEVQLLQQAFHDLMLPRYHVRNATVVQSARDLVQIQRDKVVSVPCFDASFESQLLVEANKTFSIDGRVLTFPPCCYGERCVGMTRDEGMGIRDLPEGGIVLMRAMTPAQYEALITKGEMPRNKKWPCVLCHRKNTIRFAKRMRILEQSPTQKADMEDCVAQFWCNKVDESGGYWRRYVFAPKEHEVLVAPLCESNFWSLRGVKRGVLWTIDQSPLVWQPRKESVDIRVGRNLQDFCGGAGNSETRTSTMTTKATDALPQACPTATACSASASCTPMA